MDARCVALCFFFDDDDGKGGLRIGIPRGHINHNDKKESFFRCESTRALMLLFLFFRLQESPRKVAA